MAAQCARRGGRWLGRAAGSRGLSACRGVLGTARELALSRATCEESPHPNPPLLSQGREHTRINWPASCCRSRKIGSASRRERVCQYAEFSVVALYLKKKN